jgi:predicted O-linked N-acetylglucosamine transferase (SPINDLY family)
LSRLDATGLVDFAPHVKNQTKRLHMPRCYQVNDIKAEITPPETRENAGVSIDRSVFCYLSNNDKISAEIFDFWMRILAGVNTSVL